jgi:hypothetical protein
MNKLPHNSPPETPKDVIEATLQTQSGSEASAGIQELNSTEGGSAGGEVVAGEYPTKPQPKTKQIQITMPDGSIFGVPAELVAQNRARYYGDKEGYQSRIKEYENTLKDNRELLDWAQNNMNWSDVAHAAILIRPGKVDYQEGWVNGTRRVWESDTKTTEGYVH